MNRGKLAVLGMFLLALTLAAFAVWWNVTSGRRTLDFWGNEPGRRIIDPQANVDLLWLKPPADAAGDETLSIDGLMYHITASKAVQGAPGLVHARHALLADASFDWNAPADASPPKYELAVRFQTEQGTTTAAFDFERPLIAHVESGRRQQAAEKIAAGWKQFAQRYAPASP